MHSRRKSTIPGGRNWFQMRDPCPRLPEDLWQKIEHDAQANVALRMATRLSNSALHHYKGILQNAEAQTGNGGNQKLWTIAGEKERKTFYANTLTTPQRDHFVTIQYFTGEAPRFKLITTENPAWEAFKGRIPFHINEHYTPGEYHPGGVVPLVTIATRDIPFVIQAYTEEGTLFQDLELIRKFNITLDTSASSLA
jgi:hypothetical protein